MIDTKDLEDFIFNIEGDDNDFEEVDIKFYEKDNKLYCIYDNKFNAIVEYISEMDDNLYDLMITNFFEAQMWSIVVKKEQIPDFALHYVDRHMDFDLNELDMFVKDNKVFVRFEDKDYEVVLLKDFNDDINDFQYTVEVNSENGTGYYDINLKDEFKQYAVSKAIII